MMYSVIDRSGVCVSDPSDMSTNLKQFLRCIAGLLVLDEDILGFCSPDNPDAFHLTIDGKQFIVQQTQFVVPAYDRLVGRGTTCRRAKSQRKAKRLGASSAGRMAACSNIQLAVCGPRRGKESISNAWSTSRRPLINPLASNSCFLARPGALNFCPPPYNRSGSNPQRTQRFLSSKPFPLQQLHGLKVACSRESASTLHLLHDPLLLAIHLLEQGFFFFFVASANYIFFFRLYFLRRQYASSRFGFVKTPESGAALPQTFWSSARSG